MKSMSSGALKQLVHHDLGIGVLPAAAIIPLPFDAVKRRLSDLELALSISLAMNLDVIVPESALSLLTDSIKTHFGKI